MRNRFILKTFMMFVLLLTSISVLSVTSTQAAASIGSALTAPENGWIRYDDTAPEIKYLGSTWNGAGWGGKASDSRFYKGTNHYSYDGNYYVLFKFTGTKIRIIATQNERHSNNVGITIDGVTESYSEYKAKTPTSIGQILMYEKSSLEEKEHTVLIKAINPGGISFDAIDIDGQLVELYTPINLEASGGDGQVTLSWDQVQEAESYTVRYGTEPGKYTETLTVTKDKYDGLVVPGLTNGTTYYFNVIPIVYGVEAVSSNEASATPEQQETEEPTNPAEPTNPEQPGTEEPGTEQPSGNRAIMVVTMTTGLEKEFDLSMKEVNAFIAWYEAKQAGSGKASYAIDKHDNNKGPFSSRKDYILYDRVLTFEVSEY